MQNRFIAPTIITLLFFACGLARAQTVSPAPATPTTLEEAAAQRQRAETIRKDAEKRYADEQSACYRKFQVNACLDDAKKRHTDSMIEARQLDVPAQAFQREAHREEVETEKAARAAERPQKEAEQREKGEQYRAEEAAKAEQREQKRLEKERKATENRQKLADERAKRAAKDAKRAKKNAEQIEKHAQERAKAEAKAAAKEKKDATGAAPAP